jgi:hypothetical protein
LTVLWLREPPICKVRGFTNAQIANGYTVRMLLNDDIAVVFKIGGMGNGVC